MIYLQTSHQYILVPELLIWALKPFWLLLLAPAVCQCDSSSVPVWHQKCAGRGKFADTGTTAPPLCHPAASTQRKTFHLLNFSHFCRQIMYQGFVLQTTVLSCNLDMRLWEHAPKVGISGRVGRVGRVDFPTRVDIFDSSNPYWHSWQYKVLKY